MAAGEPRLFEHCLFNFQDVMESSLNGRPSKSKNKPGCRMNQRVNVDRFGNPAVDWGPAGRTDLVGPVAFRPALTGGLALSALCLYSHSLSVAPLAACSVL